MKNNIFTGLFGVICIALVLVVFWGNRIIQVQPATKSLTAKQARSLADQRARAEDPSALMEESQRKIAELQERQEQVAANQQGQLGFQISTPKMAPSGGTPNFLHLNPSPLGAQPWGGVIPIPNAPPGMGVTIPIPPGKFDLASIIPISIAAPPPPGAALTGTSLVSAPPR